VTNLQLINGIAKLIYSCNCRWFSMVFPWFFHGFSTFRGPVFYVFTPQATRAGMDENTPSDLLVALPKDLSRRPETDWRNSPLLHWLHWVAQWLAGGLEHVIFFPYIGKSNPNWLLYFSEGLKPPARWCCGVFMFFVHLSKKSQLVALSKCSCLLVIARIWKWDAMADLSLWVGGIHFSDVHRIIRFSKYISALPQKPWFIIIRSS